MKRLNTSGIAVLAIVLVLFVFIGIFGAGYLVVKNKNNTESASKNEATQESDVVAENVGKLHLDKSKLPADWLDEVGTYPTNAINISNQTNGCFIQVTTTTDTAESNSPTVDHEADTLNAITSKGYAIEVLPDGQIDLQTATGVKSFKTLEINVSADGKSMSQIYAFDSTAERYTSLHLSCDKRADLVSTKEVFKLIRADI